MNWFNRGPNAGPPRNRVWRALWRVALVLIALAMIARAARHLWLA